jgi:hypothetical protein
MIGLVLFISGCTKQVPVEPTPKKPACIIHPTSKDDNKSIKEVHEPLVKENDDELKIVDGGGGNEVVGEYCIVDVFTDSMFSNGDRFKLIQNLDALAWEKKSLLKAYKNHTDLWNKKQRKAFQRILESDKYLSLCGERRYYDNLLFTAEEPQADILHSILFLKYINNLSNGCMQWVSQKVNNENSSKNIPSAYLLDMIEKDAIVERLFLPFVPRQKSFRIAIRDYKKMKQKVGNSQELKVRRIEIEQIKQTQEYPSYQR